MLAQYTAASLVSENKVLAHPASVDTIPTSGKQEDHVSMGWTSVRKLREVVANVRACLAVEMLCAAQGIDLRAGIAAPAAALGEVHAAIRRRVPRMDVDREVAGQIAVVDELLPDLVATSANASGGLADRHQVAGVPAGPQARSAAGRRQRRDQVAWLPVSLGHRSSEEFRPARAGCLAQRRCR